MDNLSALSSSSDVNTAKYNKCIRHIEHYANEKDMVPRWGVLYATSRLITERYAGSVFVRMGSSGHLFVPHYLDPMFPLSLIQQKIGNSKSQVLPASEHHSFNNDVENASNFVHSQVDVDFATPMKRRTPSLKPLIKPKDEPEIEFGDGQRVPVVNRKGGSSNGAVVVGFGSNDGMVVAEAARGKMVQQLSRLWMYVGGASPTD